MQSGKQVFHFAGFRLESLKFEQRLQPGDAPLEGRQFTVHVRGGNELLEGDVPTARVMLHVSVAWDGPPPFILEVEATGQFRWSEDCEGELLERLLRTQAPALIYTQIRPLVRLLAAEAGYTGFLLPTHNFVANPVEERGSSTDS